MTPIELQVLTTVATGAVAIIAVWLTSRFATQRSHDERVWNRKADAYAAIFSSIEAMQACYATWEDQEILRREISDDSAAAVREMNSQAHRRLMSTVAANSWLLSADVELRCRTMTQVLDTHQETWIDHVDACSLELALVVGDLKAIALKELGKPRFIG